MLFNLPLSVKIFATRGTQELAENIYNAAKQIINPASINKLHLGKVVFTDFSNENIICQVDNVREDFVVIIHTQAPPVSHGLMELFNLVDAIIDAHPVNVLLVFPYMPYSRSDRKNKPRISVMAKRMAIIFSKAFGIKRVILLDPHDSHIKHYFDPDADEITAVYLIVDYIERKLFKSYPKQNTVLVFPDAGAATRFRQIARILNIPTAYIDKDRPTDDENPKIKKVVGEVKEKFCLLIDDEILTGSTIENDTKTLLGKGNDAIGVCAINIHGILAEKGKSEDFVVKKMEESPIDKFIITDSVPVRHKIISSTKFIVLSVYPLLAQAIIRTVCNKSLTELHDPQNAHLYRSF